MKPPPLDYLVPYSVAEVVGLLASSEREVKVLAGGQSLLPVLNMRMAHPDVLIDICRLAELDHLEVSDEGTLRIGAAVTQSRVAADDRVQSGWPILQDAISNIGHPQIRNRGTVCGSLAHGDSAAELPCIAVLLNARLQVTGAAGSRMIPASDFFLGTFATALDPAELLVAVEFPPVPSDAGWAFAEFTQRRGDFATVGVGTTLRRRDTAISDVAIAVLGVAGAPVRLSALEQELIGAPPSAFLSSAIESIVRDELDPPSDAHGSAEFRVEIAIHLIAETIQKAWERSV